MSLIEIEDLVVRQGRFRLRVPSLRLEAGEMVAVCGNNGSGKSTFLAALAGLRRFSGACRLAGRPFRELSPLERARLVAYLPQESAVSLPFEVGYLVLTGRYPWVRRGYGEEDRRLAARTLAECNLEHLRHRPFHQLSGGEKQRVLLARTLVRGAPIVLLDEPFNAVDLGHQHRFLEIFRRVAARGLVVAVMHDLGLALEHFGRFLFFRRGKLVHDVRREDLREDVLSEVFECPLRLIECQGRYLVEVSAP